MAAFREAIRLGADGIEFDVQLTSDGQLVVMHDATVDRTTNGHGAVFEMTLAEIEALDAGAWFDERFIGERVPTLADVLALDGVDFELEFKDYGTKLLRSVLEAVDAAGVFDRVKFTGWNLPLLAMLKSERPTARVGLFSYPRQAWMTEAVFEHHVVGMAAALAMSR
jgi:glycerophosphoryl diester phosphodiesterase